MQLTAEQAEIGKDNFNETVGMTRRSFIKGAAAAGAGLGAFYFGYEALQGDPVRVAFIGTGDEGSVLINEHPPSYMDVVAIADLRPENRKKAFVGDPDNLDARMGLDRKLGTEKSATIKQYDDHKALLADKDALGLEAVVIAVPLKGHAPVAQDCLDAGLHVLSEKLMAKTITECKQLIRKARDKNLLYAVGHQRHYNVLYENAAELIGMGVLGDVKFIRAQWHRNNSFPGADSWQKDLWQQKKFAVEGWTGDPQKDAEKREAMQKKAREFGYDDMNELVNWRLYNATGGGLMAELGSHQMDACSIFLGKVHPLTVQGYGGKIFYGVQGLGTRAQQKDDRDIDDHIFVTFTFPGKNYENDANDKCVVTYSSISTNKSEPYGESVLGSRATLLVQEEQEALVFKEAGGGAKGGPDYRLHVVSSDESGAPVLDAYETGAPRPEAAEAKAGMGEKISRGYREEMEHFCYVVRNPDLIGRPRKDGGVRCDGVVAMGDAIMALTANRAMALGTKIDFKPEWFDPDSDEVPEKDHPLPGEKDSPLA
jgi:predicted dehydrogenase